jgi:plastocyanin
MFVVSVALVAYGTTAGTPSPASAAGIVQKAVTISNFAFTPSTLTVAVGTIVTWTNQAPNDHTVTADNGTSFNSGPIASGGTFSFTFTTAGTFPYHCAIHTEMTAVVIVTAAIQTASPSPTPAQTAVPSPAPAQTASPPPTSTVGDRPSTDSMSLFAMLVSLALGGLGLAILATRRRSIRR